jgi:Tfp pilus assembly protein PilV
MAWLEAALLLLSFGLLALAARQSLRVSQQLRRSSSDMRRSGALLVEIQGMLRIQQQLSQVQRLAETTIDTGTRAVQTVHQGIASIPFDLLESFAATRDATRVVRRTHDFIAGAVYGTIKGVNRKVGAAARGSLGNRRDRPAAGDPDDADETPPES